MLSNSSPAGTGSSSSSVFPVRTKLYSVHIQGVHTDFVFNSYADQLLLFITQLGTSGTIIAAGQDASFDGSTTFSTNVLLGRRDEPLITLCARQIVEAASSAGYIKPITICLGLKDHSIGTIRAIVTTITENNIWGSGCTQSVDIEQ